MAHSVPRALPSAGIKPRRWLPQAPKGQINHRPHWDTGRLKTRIPHKTTKPPFMKTRVQTKRGFHLAHAISRRSARSASAVGSSRHCVESPTDAGLWFGALRGSAVNKRKLSASTAIRRISLDFTHSVLAAKLQNCNQRDFPSQSLMKISAQFSFLPSG